MMHEQGQVPMSPNPSFQKAFSRCLAESGSVSIRLTAFGRGHLIQYMGKSSTFLIVHKRSIALAQASQWPCGPFLPSLVMRPFDSCKTSLFASRSFMASKGHPRRDWRRTRSGMALELCACESLSPSTEVRVSGKKTFPALKSFVCYKPWRAVLDAADGHETNFWQPEKFFLVDLESIYFHYTAASFYTNLTQPPA
jgi:hypothetical protein